MTPREPVRKIDKEYIFKRDKNTCVYCGAPAEVIDHVIPVYHGGSSEYINLAASCQKCNRVAGKHVFKSRLDKQVFILTTYLVSGTHYMGIFDKKFRAKRILKKIMNPNASFLDGNTAMAIYEAIAIQSELGY